jgi:hypothetical protein
MQRDSYQRLILSVTSGGVTGYAGYAPAYPAYPANTHVYTKISVKEIKNIWKLASEERTLRHQPFSIQGFRPMAPRDFVLGWPVGRTTPPTLVRRRQTAACGNGETPRRVTTHDERPGRTLGACGAALPVKRWASESINLGSP